MNTHLQKIVFLFKAIGRQITSWFLELPPYKRVMAVAGVILIIIIASRILPSAAKEEELVDMPKSVTLASVYDLSNKTTSVPLVGQVTSTNEATIRAESSGRLTKVYKKLGDKVYAGQVIAEFENSGERAAVLQAEGAYESAKAGRDIALINSANTTLGIDDIKTNTINTINSTFTTIDDIVRAKTDVAFTDPRTENPRLKVLIPDSILQSSIEQQRNQIEKMLVARFTKNLAMNNNSDLIAELQKVQAETQIVKNYLDDLGNAYVKALANQEFSQSSLDVNKSIVGGSRSAISGTLSSLSGAKVALQNGIAAESIAGRTTGDKSPNTASVDAQVKTAQGGYLSALSRLEKTIIRSPITGTLNSLTIDTGDYVTPSAQVAVVSNNGALEVVTYITSEDIKRVQVGGVVNINGKLKGVVTRIASAVDPITKKIEVRVGISEEGAQLVNGQSVRVEVGGESVSNVKVIASQIIKIPLSAVKITPRESYVFTLSGSSTLVSVPVELGTLLGEEVEIVTGLTPDLMIVKDARGLKAGEEVTVN
jgi:multidrug efflux pump subunit AcrA (membrane-fusion protein)